MAQPPYAMPPEWAPHAATWLSWPHNRNTWPDGLDGAEAALVEGVVALAEGENIHINVQDPGHAARVAALLAGRVPPERLVLEPIPTDDAWCRDHGAIIARNAEGRCVALDFRFNAWGGKYPPFDRDDAVPRHMAQALGLECVSVDMVLEGGSIDVNGAGALLTTEQCLLHPNRNPQLSRGDIEALLGRYLGARAVIWLGEGIAGDDTDGHVDDITRFVAEDTVVSAVERALSDANYRPLQLNLQRLRAARLPDGRALRVVELPMPDPLYRHGERLPASYANFYIGNRVVLVPVFDCPSDRVALEILAASFPGRRAVPIDSRELVVGLGAFHCLTQQVPAS
ncbi:MAG TPA: agmatine deiminase family protein [Burkholderiales bacterium]